MSRELSIGTMIGEYRIERVLGQGGFGITYLAHDESLARDVAIKEYFPKEFAHRDTGLAVIPNQDDQDRVDFEWGMKHFVEEARSLTRFKHRNIVSAIRLISENGTAYLVMEYCDGESLESLARMNGPLPAAHLMPIVEQLMDGLEEVHRARLLHLDVKPSNIFVKRDGTVVLLDFGSARQSVSSHTKSVKIASAGYGAIEQESAEIDAGKIGPWTDVYGLGATLYRLMTGNRPQQATARLFEDTMPPLGSVIDRRYSSGLIEVVTAAIRIKPQDRPQSIAEFRTMLHGANVAPLEREPQWEPVIVAPNVNESSFPWVPSIGLVGLVTIVVFVLSGKSPNNSEIGDSVPVEVPSGSADDRDGLFVPEDIPPQRIVPPSQHETARDNTPVTRTAPPAPVVQRVVTPARIQRLPASEDYYPADSKRAEEQGNVVIRTCVDEGGRVIGEPDVVESSGYSRLDAGAVQLAKDGRYQPGTSDGQIQSESCVSFRVRFTIVPRVLPAPAVQRVVTPARIQRLPASEDYYPAFSKRANQQGNVVVRACVDERGRVIREPDVVESSGYRRLDAGAVQLAKDGQYQPGISDGQIQSESCVSFRVRFTLGSR